MKNQKRIGHFTFRTEKHEGKMPSVPGVEGAGEEVSLTLEVLYVKGHGSAWKRAGAWKGGRPAMEEAEELLNQVAEAEKLEAMVAVPAIPVVRPTGKASFVVTLETDGPVPSSLLESYALELVSAKECWRALHIGGGRVRLSFVGKH